MPGHSWQEKEERKMEKEAPSPNKKKLLTYQRSKNRRRKEVESQLGSALKESPTFTTILI